MSIKDNCHYDDLNKKYYTYKDGSKIPSSICLCFAREPSECCCDCTGWDNYKYDEDWDG